MFLHVSSADFQGKTTRLFYNICIYIYTYTHIYIDTCIYLRMRSDMILIYLEIWNMNKYTTIQLSVPLPLAAKKALAAPWPRASLLFQSWRCKRFFAPDFKHQSVKHFSEQTFRGWCLQQMLLLFYVLSFCFGFLEAFSITLSSVYGVSLSRSSSGEQLSRMTPTPHKK